MAHRSTQVRQKQFEVSARTSSEIAASPMPSAFTSTVPRITSAPATDGVSHVITRHPFTSTATRLQVDTPQSHHRRDVAPSMLASASVNSSTSTSSGNLPPRLPGTASAVSSKQSPTHSSIFSSPPTAIGKTVQDPLVARFERLKLTLSGEQNSPSQIGKSSQNTISSAREQPSFDDIKPARLSNNIMATSSPMLQGLTSQPTQYRPSSFVPRSQPVPKMSTRDTEPVVIDDSDEDESDGEQQPPPSRRRTFHRPNPFQRSSRMNTRVRESIGNKTQSISRRRPQRLRSTVSKNTALTGLSDSPNSSDVSYPDLSKALKEFENTPRSSTQLTTGVLAVSPKLRDRRVTARPQHPELVEQDVSQIPHTQTTVGVGVKSPVGVGTRDDPIDLDQWSLPEPMDVGRSGDEPYHASDVVQFSTDALLAHRLQKDEDRAEQTTIRARECAVCGDEYPVNTLPSLSACTHPPQTCGTCYAGWVTAQLQQSGWREAKCPESKCQTRLEYHDIQHIVSRDVFEQYDTYIARTALGEDPNFRWCRACLFGQVHMNGEEGNIFTCAACGHKMCIIHESTWHEGETCEEYEYRASGRQERDRKAQEEASLDAIGKLTKKCPGPNCVYNIEKNHGCDHMTCSRCRHEFCWICLCDYNEIRRRGNSAHAENCQHHSRRLH